LSGYGSNPEFFARVTPQAARLVSTAIPQATGDGILAAIKLGAQFRNADKHLATLGGIETVPGSGRCDWNGAWANVYTAVYRPPLEIYVNERGERFINEDESSPDRREHAVFAQPGQRFWIIFDEAAIDAGSPLIRSWDGATLRAKAQEGQCAWVAEDLRELARKAGIHPDGLLNSVAQFNQAARTGVDPLGRRKLDHAISQPPFYAALSYAAALVTFGGLAVDTKLRVLDEAGRPIKGLYAIGEILGLGATSGRAFCSGMMLTPAISFGRMLGDRLARLSKAE
jgi:fumarate reductase flavoprotein subunit